MRLSLFFSLARLDGVEVPAGDPDVLRQPLRDLHKLLCHLPDCLLAMIAKTSSTSAFKNAAIAACMSHVLLNCADDLAHYGLERAGKPGRLFVVELSVRERPGYS